MALQQALPDAVELAPAIAGPPYPNSSQRLRELQFHRDNTHVFRDYVQLSLRLRLDFGQDFRWCGSGWRDA